ncbi:MAG: GNAT family N-acetyltransferase [Christensenellaceae bacterium]|jgi:ribosomal protein S18 acetylase RimI-like enzyme
MELYELNEMFREEVNAHVKREWNGPKIVSKGNIYHADHLPGFVAAREGKLLGAVLYVLREKECEVAVLFSLEGEQGIATRLLQAVQKVAEENDCVRIWLITTNDNLHAIRFYEKRGFSLCAIHIGAFEITRTIKFPAENIIIGNHEIPILHEIEFEKMIV